MLIIVVISLYTSRIILKTLGIQDYGIYNVVGGFVAMIAYLRGTFVGSTQRFISYTLGQKDIVKLTTVFAVSITVYLILILLVILLAETFGIWFINHKLQIPVERLEAANWVFQCSVGVLVLSMISVPYNACIIAHEHMHVYAYISVLESILKLVIVYFLLISPFDKLIFYSVLFVIVSAIITFSYIIYCTIKFKECKFSFTTEKKLLKEMFSFSGWTMIGSLGFSFKDNFSNIIMNMFLGTSINAARGISAQVNGIVSSFSSSIYSAISPQITKQYAAGEFEESRKLVYYGMRFAFFIMSLLTIPLILNVDFVLKIWLGSYPIYTKELLIITLITSTIYAMSMPLTTAIQATGVIRNFQIGVCIIMLLELPITWLFLSLGYAPYIAMVPSIITNCIAIIFRVFMIKKQIKDYSIRYMILNIGLKCIFLYIIIISICGITTYYLSQNQINSVFCICACILITTLILFYGGLNKSERVKIKTLIAKKIKKVK